MSHKNQGSHWIRPARRAAILLRDDLTCCYCGAHTHTGGERDDLCATLDHVLPRAAGGSNDSDNLVCACRKCNADKADSITLAIIGAAILRAAMPARTTKRAA